MRKIIPISFITILLISGCGNSSSKSKYDELEIVRYQACIDFYLKGALDKGVFYAMAPQIVDDAQKECFQLEPEKE